MNQILEITPNDPLIARDGRPFGEGQGNRMRGLPWPLPSVVAGSFRTALVKVSGHDFSGNMPQTLLERVEVHGLFPVHGEELYLPAPNDCVWDDKTDKVHRVQPIPLCEGEGVDFPCGDLRPVRLTQEQEKDDFKAKPIPAWWPLSKYAEWLTNGIATFDQTFLNAPITTYRDHVKLDPNTGAAEESHIFSTANLNIAHLPRFGAKLAEPSSSLEARFAAITLTAKVKIDDPALAKVQFDHLHPLGGERRLVHWKSANSDLWSCPNNIRDALKTATKIRMVLATPAIFENGWKPDFNSGPLKDCNLKLVGVSNGRWKAISGWSLAPSRGPKPIRRMVPAGSVYFFTVENPGDAERLADLWLQSVSNDKQEQRDGFGLAVWGTWSDA